MVVHNKLGGDIAKTADTNGPEGYPIPYDTMLSNKSWGKEGKNRGTFNVMVFVFPSNGYM